MDYAYTQKFYLLRPSVRRSPSEFRSGWNLQPVEIETDKDFSSVHSLKQSALAEITQPGSYVVVVSEPNGRVSLAFSFDVEEVTETKEITETKLVIA